MATIDDLCGGDIKECRRMFERQAKEGAESFLHQTPENGKEQIIFIGSEVATLRLFREWVGLGYEIYQCQTITGQYAFFMYLE